MLNLKTKTLNKLTASNSFDKKKFDRLLKELDKFFKKEHKGAFVDFGTPSQVSHSFYTKEYRYCVIVQTNNRDDSDFIDDDKYLEQSITPIAKKYGFSLDGFYRGSGSLGAVAVEVGFTPYEVVDAD